LSKGSIKIALQKLNMTIMTGPQYALAAVAQGVVPIILEKIKDNTEDGINVYK
jgi:hypothetical protein